jgi:hypothetical protein
VKEPATSQRRLNAAQKQAEALRLRATGMSFEKIAKELGYRGHQGAHRAVTTGLEKTLREPADELRTLEAERLDRMLEGIWEKAINGGTWQIDRVLSIMDRRAKLLGLDTNNDIGRQAVDEATENFRIGAEATLKLYEERKAKSTLE